MGVPLARPGRLLDRGAGRAGHRPSPSGVLSHETVLGPDIHLDVDLMALDRWCADGERPASWVRLGVIEAVDRWFPLPLDQALVDAERGVARGRAAQALTDHGVRRAVLCDALLLARQASDGLVHYLAALGSRGRALPSGLGVALHGLVEGYGELLAEVDGRADRELAAVGEAWRALAKRLPKGGGPLAVVRGLEQSRPRRVRASLLDPRQVRARVFALSTDPAVGEIVLADAYVGGGPAVHVRVPAYRSALDNPVVQRLLVRIMDATSTEVLGQSVLTPTRRGRRTVCFESVVPLHRKRVGRLRADVFDLLSKVPPACDDVDAELGAARRASVLLGEWRRLVAIAQLPAVGFSPARQLRELARRLAPGGDRERPLFAGGPSSGDLDRMAAAGDQEILHRACAGSEPGLFAMAGGLLVAELAAVRTARSS